MVINFEYLFTILHYPRNNAPEECLCPVRSTCSVLKAVLSWLSVSAVSISQAIIFLEALAISFLDWTMFAEDWMVVHGHLSRANPMYGLWNLSTISNLFTVVEIIYCASSKPSPLVLFSSSIPQISILLFFSFLGALWLTVIDKYRAWAAVLLNESKAKDFSLSTL